MQTDITPISGDLGGGLPDGMTLSNTLVALSLATPGAIKTGTTANDTVLLQGYDVDGAAQKTFLTITAGNTPSAALAAPSGGTLTIDGAVIGGTTPLAATVTTLTSTALSATTIVASGNITASTYVLKSVGNGLTAIGANRAGALQLAKERNIVSSAAASTGVLLPVGVIGMDIIVVNNGANPITVYATASETIDTVAGSTGVPLANAKAARFMFNAANTWISAQLGAVSA